MSLHGQLAIAKAFKAYLKNGPRTVAVPCQLILSYCLSEKHEPTRLAFVDCLQQIANTETG